MNAVITPKKTFKDVCIGGHSVLIMKNVAMASSHAMIEMINMNFFIIMIMKDKLYY
jgi:hypothetical protein